MTKRFDRYLQEERMKKAEELIVALRKYIIFIDEPEMMKIERSIIRDAARVLSENGIDTKLDMVSYNLEKGQLDVVLNHVMVVSHSTLKLIHYTLKPEEPGAKKFMGEITSRKKIIEEIKL